MSVRRVEKSEWQGFCNSLSKILVGAQTEIHVASLALGDQIQAEWLPLHGVVYDHKDDTIEISLEGLDHRIRRPRELHVDESAGGVVSLQIVDGDGVQRIINFREPIMLPAPKSSPAV